MVKVNVSRVSQDPGTDPQEFTVEVGDIEKTKTLHQVLVSRQMHQRLTGGLKSSEELVKTSFEFLLEREPKESILKSFDLGEIQKYFPEYETLISAQLAK